MKQSFTKLLHWLRSLRTKTIFLFTFIAVVLIATTISLSNTFSSASKQLKDKIQGEEIGNNKLRYKHGEYIYNPETGKILIDSIDWLHVAYGDTIGILAKNKRRAYINLNSAELITPLEYEKAWTFSCNRGVMVKNDTIFIFRRDGSLINPDGFKYKGQYELIFHHDKLVVNVDNDKCGLIDTTAQWVLQPNYSKIENEYQHRLYNTMISEQCIIYNYDLDTILIGNYKSIDVDWSEGLIATEYNGIQHLFSYEGKLIYEVIFKDIEELTYNTGRKDAHGNTVWEETNCFVYVDYNNKKGLMDKHYHVLTPPLFYDINAKTKHTFFASFGEWSNRFGTLIDDHGKPIR